MTALETQLLTEAAVRQDRVDLKAKIAALAAFLARVLGAHSSDYLRPGRIATHLADEVVQAGGRADRVAIMGEPARYAEIEWLGRADGGDAVFGGASYSAPQRFRVFVYYGRGAERQADAAASFRALCESTDPAMPGVLFAAEAVGLLLTPDSAGTGNPAGFDELAMSAPSEVRTALVFPSGSRPDDGRHELAFQLSIT